MTSNPYQEDRDRIAGLTYPFERPYQLKVLRLVVGDSTFLPRYGDALQPRHFEQVEMMDLARLAGVHLEKHGRGPTLAATEQAARDMIAERCRRSGQDEKKLWAPYARLLKEVATALEQSEIPDVCERVVEFAKDQAIRLAVLDGLADLDAGDQSGLFSRLAKAREVGSGHSDRGFDFFAQASKTFVNRRSVGAIPFGWPGLDRITGGHGRQETIVVMGGPKAFKTGSLVNMGANAYMHGSDVVHYQLEGRPDAAARRYLGKFARMIPGEASDEDIDGRLAELRKRFRRTLWIKRFPINTVTASMLSSHLRGLALDGLIDPANRQLTVVVDYPQIMRAERQRDSLRHEQRECYQGVINISREWDCHMLTAAQLNRAGADKPVAGPKDLSECFAISQDTDMGIAICRDQDEMDREEARFVVCWSRETEDHRFIRLSLDKKYTRIEEIDPEIPTGARANGRHKPERIAVPEQEPLGLPKRRLRLDDAELDREETEAENFD